MIRFFVFVLLCSFSSKVSIAVSIFFSSFDFAILSILSILGMSYISIKKKLFKFVSKAKTKTKFALSTIAFCKHFFQPTDHHHLKFFASFRYLFIFTVSELKNNSVRKIKFHPSIHTVHKFFFPVHFLSFIDLAFNSIDFFCFVLLPKNNWNLMLLLLLLFQ